MSTCLSPSGISQLIVWQVCKKFGIEGFIDYCQTTAKVYETRCLYMISMLKKYFPPDSIKYEVPSGGMFLWIQMLTCTDTFDIITKKALDAKVVCVPGNVFFPIKQVSNHLRLSFSFASLDEIEIGIQRLSLLFIQNKNERV